MANQTQGPLPVQEYAPSKAAIRGHPIHPMLVPLPIGAFVGLLVCDITYAATRNTFWAQMSFWLVAAGVATGLLAALFGMTDFFSLQRPRLLRAGWVHFIGNLVAVGLGLITCLMRYREPVAAAYPSGLTFSIIIGAILMVTGWMGGEMAYRYLIGVNPDRSVLRGTPPGQTGETRRAA